VTAPSPEVEAAVGREERKLDLKQIFQMPSILLTKGPQFFYPFGFHPLVKVRVSERRTSYVNFSARPACTLPAHSLGQKGVNRMYASNSITLPKMVKDMLLPWRFTRQETQVLSTPRAIRLHLVRSTTTGEDTA